MQIPITTNGSKHRPKKIGYCEFVSTDGLVCGAEYYGLSHTKYCHNHDTQEKRGGRKKYKRDINFGSVIVLHNHDYKTIGYLKCACCKKIFPVTFWPREHWTEGGNVGYFTGRYPKWCKNHRTEWQRKYYALCKRKVANEKNN